MSLVTLQVKAFVVATGPAQAAPFPIATGFLRPLCQEHPYLRMFAHADPLGWTPPPEDTWLALPLLPKLTTCFQHFHTPNVFPEQLLLSAVFHILTIDCVLCLFSSMRSYLLPWGLRFFAFSSVISIHTQQPWLGAKHCLNIFYPPMLTITVLFNNIKAYITRRDGTRL